MSPIVYFRQRIKLLPGCESTLYVVSDVVMGHLGLEDIKLGVLEHKILLVCSPASAFMGTNETRCPH